MILGPDGRPISPAKPITREIAVASIRDRWSSYPSQGLTPERLARIFKEADAGDVYRQAELFEEMEAKDPHLFSVLQTRKNAVVGLDYDILPYSDEPRDKEVAEFVAAAVDGIAGFEDALRDLLDAIGKGYSVLEIMWSVRDGKALVDRLVWVHQKRFTWVNSVDMRLVTEANPLGEDLPPYKFVVHHYQARSGHPSGQGVLRVCAWMYLFKNYCLKDWVAFAEVFGMPLRLGKYDPGASQEDREQLKQAVTQLGTDAAGIIPRSTEIEFVEAKGQQGADVYERLAAWCDAQMSKAVLGQTLTTEVGSRGSYAASQTHAEVRQDLLEADAKSLAETLRRDLIRPLVLFNYGPEAAARLPWVKFHYEPPEDLKQAAETYATLVKDIGLPVAAEHLYDKFGVPQPEPGQALVSPPGPAPAAPMKDAVAVPMRSRLSPAFQAAVDRLADRAVSSALPFFEGLEEDIRRVVRESSSLEEVRDRLLALYAGRDPAELADILARALYAADMYGRWTVMQDG